MNSNANLAKNATAASAAAKTASDNAKDGDGSHGKASSAHYDAAYAQSRAGNDAGIIGASVMAIDFALSMESIDAMVAGLDADD
jgi:hypothetical protein